MNIIKHFDFTCQFILNSPILQHAGSMTIFNIFSDVGNKNGKG